jgi:glutamine synthetase
MTDATYDRLRVLFPDHHGIARGKYVPAKFAGNRTHHCVSLFNLDFDRTMIDAPGGMLLAGSPDVDVSFEKADIRASWEDDRTGVVVGDLSYRDEPFSIAPRTILRNAIDAWAKHSVKPMVGIELEAYILQPDGKGGWTEWDTPRAFVYGTGTAVDPTGLMDDIMWTAERVGLPLESLNSEYDTPQFELTLEFGETLRHVDDIFLFKVMCQELAAKRGLLLTFLGKPFNGKGGSGLHVNLSMQNKRGKNAFLDVKGPSGLSLLAQQSIAGLLAHHEAMAAFCAPTVNAYKRLRPAMMSGYWANWGVDHRHCTVRIPADNNEGKRIEHRMSDGAANPYLATAAVLNAARLGVEAGLALPPQETLDGIESAGTTASHVPDNLGLSMDALLADEALSAAMGGAPVVDYWTAIKRNEHDKFMAAVTDWELNHYLGFL